MNATEFKSYDALTATAESDALTEREKYRIDLAVTATRGCTACTGGRIEKAIETGIDYETVRAAIDLAAPVNVGVTIQTAIEGAERHALDKACVGPEYSVGAHKARWRDPTQ